MDKRNEILAKNIVNYSCNLQPGEKILIESRGVECEELVNCIIKEVYNKKAIPFVWLENPTIKRELLMNTCEEQLKIMSDIDYALMKQVDAYVGITAGSNNYEASDIPLDKLELFNKIYGSPVHLETRLSKKWVILKYPTPNMAQAAKQSTEAFKDFYYNVCNLDYNKMNIAMDSLKNLMEKTDKVQIIGKDTNLTFSIKNIPAVKCSGHMNIPDGEVYTAPVKNSVNGYITYNTPSTYQSFSYENIRLEFKDGKIINATANDTKRINKVFDVDEGARYIGEFSLGLNPYIKNPMNDILFDEKIMGSFHFTPGNSYKDAFNGNKSSLHWDLVCIQTKEYGGGEIYFDDMLIRKDGIFVLKELECLNPENLI